MSVNYTQVGKNTVIGLGALSGFMGVIYAITEFIVTYPDLFMKMLVAVAVLIVSNLIGWVIHEYRREY